MSKEQFRELLEHTLLKGDLGVVLWPTPEIYKSSASKLLPGGDFYEDTISLLNCGILVRHLAELFPHSIRIIVVPASKSLANEEMLQEAYHYANFYLGPCTYFPSGETFSLI